MAWTRLLLALPLVACTSSSPSATPPDSGNGSDTGSGSGSGSDSTTLTAKEQLGQKLFNDVNLSEPAGESCASCHDPKHAFAGNNNSAIAGVSAGAAPGAFGTRNTPTAMYAMFIPSFHFEDDPSDGPTPTGGQFWDGRADSLAQQAQGPLLNPLEMNNTDAAMVAAKVRKADYASQFLAVYGASSLDDDQRAFDGLADAIAAFEQTKAFRPFNSDFDAFLRGERQLTAQQARGFALFKDPEKGNCIACHVGDTSSTDPAAWLFTDHTYDNLGVPRNTTIPANADASHYDLGLCQAPGIQSKLPDGVDVESLCGAFRVPTLRNVAVTGPYFHNGRFDNLRDVVKFYVTRDTNPELWYPAGQKFDDLPDANKANVNQEEVPYDRMPGDAPHLNDEEIDDVVAFLGALTDR